MTETVPEQPVSEVPEEVRARLAIPVDVDDLVVGLRLARQVRPWFGVAKVGLELYTAEGAAAVEAMVDLGFKVFLDLKLHDIPVTVGRAARVCGALGIDYLTVHTAGGEAALRAAVAGVAEGAHAVESHVPAVLGVTVLTSDPDASPEVLRARMALAARTGCGGVVCAPTDLALARAEVPDLLKVTPGVRPASLAVEGDDQARTATPADAIAAGAGLLVVGRPVTQADDPAAAAAAVAAEVAAALAAEQGAEPEGAPR